MALVTKKRFTRTCYISSYCPHLDRLRRVAQGVVKGSHVEHPELALQCGDTQLIHLFNASEWAYYVQKRTHTRGRAGPTHCRNAVKRGQGQVMTSMSLRSNSSDTIPFPKFVSHRKLLCMVLSYLFRIVWVRLDLFVLRSNSFTSPLSYPAATHRSVSL